jgi:hypothetical protein
MKDLHFGETKDGKLHECVEKQQGKQDFPAWNPGKLETPFHTHNFR